MMTLPALAAAFLGTSSLTGSILIFLALLLGFSSSDSCRRTHPGGCRRLGAAGLQRRRSCRSGCPVERAREAVNKGGPKGAA